MKQKLTGKQKCRKCGETKSLSQFYKDARCKGGYRHICHSCDNRKDRKDYKSNPDRRTAKIQSAVNTRMKRVYGINLDDYNKMFIEQDGRCKICGEHQKGLKRRLDVDHSHKTGKVRGLLCSLCNLTVGLIENCDIEVVLDYIKKNK